MKYILSVILIGVILYISFLGLRGLCEPDEGRYAEISREMTESGDYIQPRLNYIKHFHKPPLVYWMVSASFALFGVNEFTARLPIALIAVLGLILVYFLAVSAGRDKKCAFIISIVLATSLQYFVWSQVLAADMVFSFFIYMALFGFWNWHTRKRSIYILYIGLAFAFMVKGPVALIVVFLIILFYLGLTKQWNMLKQVKFFKGSLLFLALICPWFVYVCMKNPGLLRYFVFNQSIDRLVTTSHGREGSIFYFIPVILLGFLPWIVFLPGALVRYRPWRKNDKTFFFIFLWFIIPLLFFSLSSSKLPGYILPVYPALTFFAGSYIYDRGFYRKFVFIGAITGIIYLCGVVFLPSIEDRLGNNMSIRKISEYLNEETSSEDTIVNYRCFLQGLPFYMKKRVILVERGREMQFEENDGEHMGYMFSNMEDFTVRLQPGEVFWCFSPAKDLQDLQNEVFFPVYEIWRKSDYILVSNARPKLVPDTPLAIGETQDSRRKTQD